MVFFHLSLFSLEVCSAKLLPPFFVNGCKCRPPSLLPQEFPLFSYPHFFLSKEKQDDLPLENTPFPPEKEVTFPPVLFLKFFHRFFFPLELVKVVFFSLKTVPLYRKRPPPTSGPFRLLRPAKKDLGSAPPSGDVKKAIETSAPETPL